MATVTVVLVTTPEAFLRPMVTVPAVSELPTLLLKAPGLWRC